MPTLSLLTSLSTLLCCALPALLVTVGAGATLASIASSTPWLVALSKYKVWSFVLSALLILAAGFFRWKSRNMPCPVNKQQAKACMRLRRISAYIYWASVIIWFIGFFFAFIAVHLFY